MVKRRKLVQQIPHQGMHQRKYWSNMPPSPCALCHSLFQICDTLITGGWIIFQFHKVSYQSFESLLTRHFLTEMSVGLFLPITWIRSGSAAMVQDTVLVSSSGSFPPRPSFSLPCWSLSGWWQQQQPAGLCVVMWSLDIWLSFDPLLRCPYTDTQTASRSAAWLLVACRSSLAVLAKVATPAFHQ